MATYSTVMGLKLNDPSDAFQLSDFTANWGLLDASPGTFICTSTSRPSWGTAQKGRLIFMTDLKQTSYWDGSAWQDLRDSAPVFAGSVALNTSVAAGTTTDFNILTFTTPRPCSLAVFLSATYTCANNASQDAWQSVYIDGGYISMAYTEQIRFSGNSADVANTAGINAMSPGIAASVSSGQHKIALHLVTSSTYKTALHVVGAKVLAFISLYSAGNSL